METVTVLWFWCQDDRRLLTIISKLYEIDFTIVAVTCDLGPSHRKVLNYLGIRVDKSKEAMSYCCHPCNAEKNCFADVPHFIKVI